MNTEVHVVPDLVTPIRLQEYGVGKFIAAATKSALKKALKKGFVSIDGVPVTSATFINGGERIRLSVPDQANTDIKLVLSLRVLFEDDYLAVIHKPAGILVSGNSFRTVTNGLPQNIKRSNLPDVTKPQPVHRLDYATTGALLIGKTCRSIRALNKLFEDKKVSKTYYAVTIGNMDDAGEIASAVDGRSALSKYEVVGTVPSKRFGMLNLVRLSPETGRRHQLRKHLAGIGNPILGDQKYGLDGLILKGKGMYLHAYSLVFSHPFTGEDLCIKSELPKGFGKLFPENTEGIHDGNLLRE